MEKKIVIVGPAASGKDTLRRRLEKKGYKYGRPYTTRPERKGETCFDYFFCTDAYFTLLGETGRIAVTNEYNGWRYGLTQNTLDYCNLFVLTPDFLAKLGESFSRDSFVIYLNPSEEDRRERLSKRHDADSVERRIEDDRRQFDGFDGYDVMITNTDF